MPTNLHLDTLKTLWLVAERAAREPYPETGELELLVGNKRNMQLALTRLRTYGFKVKFIKSQDRYRLDWPSMDSMELSQEQMFYLTIISRLYSDVETDGQAWRDLATKFTLNRTDLKPVVQCPPGNETRKFNDVTPRFFNEIKSAILDQRKCTVFYESMTDSRLRVVHPYVLIQTPMSWFLAAWCEERKDFRNFKLSRIRDLKVSGRFTRLDFNLNEHLGDAWWLQQSKGSERQLVRVLFKGDAAKTILEYHHHPSQKSELVEGGTLVTWELSYLGEFTTWLMQWVGNIEVLSPESLKNDMILRMRSFS